MRFVENFWDADNPRWLKRFVIGFLIFLAAFHFWNAWHFNPYWGYDGGGHLDYIFSLADGHWPSISKNYIAWHEPLYYIFMAAIARVHRGLHFLGLVQVMLSFGVAAMSWLVIQKLTTSSWARAISFAVWNCLPAVTLASAFVTNELLNYFFILLVLLFGLNVVEKKQTEHTAIMFGVICGFALLTKITAIVAIGAVLLVIARKNEWKTAFMIAGIAMLMYTPWIGYKVYTGQPGLAVNNTSYLAPAPLALDSRVKFFLNFDSDIFIFPYWYSGAQGFWSMLYADTFWDYYGMMQNRDWLAQLPAQEKISTNHNGGEIMRSILPAARSLPYLAIPLLLILLLGTWQLVKRPLELPSLFTFLLFSSLIYFAYRYPFYDRGIVKSIFIGPAFLPILAAGFTAFESRVKSTWGKPVISILIFVYVVMLLRTVIIPAFGY